MDLFKCPSCGHKYELTVDHVGKKLMCKKCNAAFRASPENRIQQALIAPAEAKAEMEEPAPPALVQKALENSSLVIDKAKKNSSLAIEGAVPGAMGGIVAGIVAGIVSGVPNGEAVGPALLGFVVGFSIGVFLGAVAGTSGALTRSDSGTKPVLTTALLGGVTGAVVGVLIGGDWCTLWGALAGTVGAAWWPWLCNRVEQSMALPTESAGEAQEPADQYGGKRNRRNSTEDVLHYHHHH